MPNASPIDIANIPPPLANKSSPTSSTFTSTSSTATSGFSTSPRTPANIPTMAFSPLTRTTSREQSGMAGAAGGGGGGYFGGAALGRTISGGSAVGSGAGAGGLLGDKSKKGEGVLRRLSLSGMGGFRPSFLSPTSQPASAAGATPNAVPTTTSIPAPLPQGLSRSMQDPFSGGAIHEEDHDHDHAFESTDSVPGLTRAHSVGKQDRPRRVSFGWPGFGGGGGSAAASGDAVEVQGLPPTEFEPLGRAHPISIIEPGQNVTPVTSASFADELGKKGKVSFAGNLEDSELGLGKVKSLGEDGQRRGRRNSEGVGKGKRGVSPMGEHILRGGGHF